MGQPCLYFVHFRSFQRKFYRKFVDSCGIRTRIIGREVEQDDHLTTTARIDAYLDRDVIAKKLLLGN